ncbi:MAG TPA: hypothetical protein VFF76_07300 [Holophagaceae bacterium]|nr:hypothetical protein [Holophagaceae bacterium]
MTPHSALILLGTFCAVALLGASAAMVCLRLQLRSSQSRERALPAGRAQLSPALWDGKAALDRAEDASRTAMAQADGDSGEVMA